MLKLLFVLWLLTVAAGMALSARGAKQDNARKRALGRRLLLAAAAVVIFGLVVLAYATAVSGAGS